MRLDIPFVPCADQPCQLSTSSTALQSRWNSNFHAIQTLQTGELNRRKWALLAEVQALRKEAEKHNTPATFARCAKYQRQVQYRRKCQR